MSDLGWRRVRKRGLVIAGGLALAVVVALWALTAPHELPASELAAGYRPSLANGQQVFNAGNCSACHMTPGQADRAQLAGGLKLSSPFGVFVTPNITSDRRYGIGAWSELDFLNAMKRGVGRHGEHLYPAFPYPSYSRMK